MKSTIQGQQALTFARHCEIGVELHNTIDRLYALRRELEHAPKNKQTNQAMLRIMATIEQLYSLQMDMESLLFASPCVADATKNPCNVYYGPFNEVAQ